MGVAYIVQNAGDVFWLVNEKWVVHWAHATTTYKHIHPHMCLRFMTHAHATQNKWIGRFLATNNNNKHAQTLTVESTENFCLEKFCCRFYSFFIIIFSFWFRFLYLFLFFFQSLPILLCYFGIRSILLVALAWIQCMLCIHPKWPIKQFVLCFLD